MKKLSVMEQKRIVGGYWVLKVYSCSYGALVEKHYENTKQECIDWFEENYNTSEFSDIYVEIR